MDGMQFNRSGAVETPAQPYRRKHDYSGAVVRVIVLALILGAIAWGYMTFAGALSEPAPAPVAEVAAPVAPIPAPEPAPIAPATDSTLVTPAPTSPAA